MSYPLKDRYPRHPQARIQRNIIFFGEIGTGKSSTINLLLETGAAARVSNDSKPCTKANTNYETTLNGTKCNLWDTRGLGEGRNFFRTIFGGSSEKVLKKFLKERHRRHEIDLLVYCARGSRATEASVKYYADFCAITRRLAAPVVIVVTQLEREKDMEDWWSRNSSRLKELKMEFDDHVCITALPEHARRAESKKKLTNLITRNRCWEARESGSYFGSSVQKPPPPTRHHATKGTSNYPASSHRVPSTTDSSYHTANSPAGSRPPSLLVVPPSPRSDTTSAKVPHINTNLPGVGDRSQSSSDKSTGSSLHPMFPNRYASITHLKLLTYRTRKVLTAVTLYILKCTWNLAQKKKKVCSQKPLKTMHSWCACYRLLG